MALISKRRLAGLASASVMIATVAVTAVPAATFAATCTPTGFIRDSINLTAAKIGGTVTGDLDATGCDIGAYNPTRVSGADIHGATYFGVVVAGVRTVNVTGSKVHQIGNSPFDGTQHGRAILYINGARGTISGNQVSDFQKNGIEVSGLAADGIAPSSHKTSVTVKNNVVTGNGPVDYIAQNGIVIRSGANATVAKNTVTGFNYEPEGAEACGLLLYAAGRVNLRSNNLSGNEVNIYSV